MSQPLKLFVKSPLPPGSSPLPADGVIVRQFEQAPVRAVPSNSPSIEITADTFIIGREADCSLV
ncbi:MAG: hypothetical protein HY762_04490, partial [Planctomycetes bacterium]|nr:hypothetical protein [Planctomycetota bacterium]